MFSNKQNAILENLKKASQQHRLFREIKRIGHLRIFMENHVYAVWDFMSLLKSQQHFFTGFSIPWKILSVDRNLSRLINEIVLWTLDLAKSGKAHEVASAFFFGREDLIPDMFTELYTKSNLSHLKCSRFHYYLNRHIELGADEHGPAAKKCLETLVDTPSKKTEAFRAAKKSLENRIYLWDCIFFK